MTISSAGFYFNGNDDEAELNTATGAYENGFTVDGDDGNGSTFSGARLRANKASACVGQGFAVINQAGETRLTRNTASGNSVDYCDAGLRTVLDNDNAFGTTATQCLISRGDPVAP